MTTVRAKQVTPGTTPSNYSPTPASPRTVDSDLAGIDAALGAAGGQTLFDEVISSRAELDAATGSSGGPIFVVTTRLGVRSGATIALNAGERIVVDVAGGGSLRGVDRDGCRITGDVPAVSSSLIELSLGAVSDERGEIANLDVENTGVGILVTGGDDVSGVVERCRVRARWCLVTGGVRDAIFRSCSLRYVPPGAGGEAAGVLFRSNQARAFVQDCYIEPDANPPNPNQAAALLVGASGGIFESYVEGCVIQTSPNALGVLAPSGSLQPFVIKGCTFHPAGNGSANGNYRSMFFDFNVRRLTVEGCTFVNSATNSATSYAMRFDSVGLVSQCSFVGNRSGLGLIDVEDTSVFEGNVVADNQVEGTLYRADQFNICRTSTFANNQSTGRFPLIRPADSFSETFFRNTVVGNQVDPAGPDGRLFNCVNLNDACISECVVAFNHAAVLVDRTASFGLPTRDVAFHGNFATAALLANGGTPAAGAFTSTSGAEQASNTNRGVSNYEAGAPTDDFPGAPAPGQTLFDAVLTSAADFAAEFGAPVSGQYIVPSGRYFVAADVDLGGDAILISAASADVTFVGASGVGGSTSASSIRSTNASVPLIEVTGANARLTLRDVTLRRNPASNSVPALLHEASGQVQLSNVDMRTTGSTGPTLQLNGSLEADDCTFRTDQPNVGQLLRAPTGVAGTALTATFSNCRIEQYLDVYVADGNRDDVATVVFDSCDFASDTPRLATARVLRGVNASPGSQSRLIALRGCTVGVRTANSPYSVAIDCEALTATVAATQALVISDNTFLTTGQAAIQLGTLSVTTLGDLIAERIFIQGNQSLNGSSPALEVFEPALAGVDPRVYVKSNADLADSSFGEPDVAFQVNGGPIFKRNVWDFDGGVSFGLVNAQTARLFFPNALFDDIVTSRAELDAATGSGGGPVFTITSRVGIPAGATVTLNPGETIVVDVAAGGSLRGMDPEHSRIVGDLSGAQSIITLLGVSGSSCVLSHLNVINSGSPSPGSSPDCVRLDSGGASSNLVVRDCILDGVTGISVQAAPGARIESCRTRSDGGTGRGIEINSDGVAVTDCELVAVGTSNSGIVIGDHDDVRVQNTLFRSLSNSSCLNVTGAGTRVRLTISGCAFENDQSLGGCIELNTAVEALQVSDCRFFVGTDSGRFGIAALQAVSEAQIVNCESSAGILSCVDLNNCVVQGNVCSRQLIDSSGNVSFSNVASNRNLGVGISTADLVVLDRTSVTSYVGNVSRGAVVSCSGGANDVDDCVFSANIAASGSLCFIQSGNNNVVRDTTFMGNNSRNGTMLGGAAFVAGNGRISRGNRDLGGPITDFG